MTPTRATTILARHHIDVTGLAPRDLLKMALRYDDRGARLYQMGEGTTARLANRTADALRVKAREMEVGNG